MEKVDIAIAAVGAVALVATTLGVIFYEELAGTVDVEFDDQRMAIAEQTGAPGSFTFEIPMNATGADVTIDVAFTGQSAQGGTATVDVVLTAPNGTTVTRQGTITVGANSGAATGTLTVPAMWDMKPSATTTTDPQGFDASRSYAQPMTVSVSITNPPDPLAGTVPGTGYSWEVTVGGEWHTYAHSFETGDVESV